MAVTGLAAVHIGGRMEEIYLRVFFTRPAIRNGRKPAGNLQAVINISSFETYAFLIETAESLTKNFEVDAHLMMLQRSSIRTWIFYWDIFKHVAVTGLAAVHIGGRMKEISYLRVFFTRPAVRNGRKSAGNWRFMTCYWISSRNTSEHYRELETLQCYAVSRTASAQELLQFLHSWFSTRALLCTVMPYATVW